jgi:hypothetical protein
VPPELADWFAGKPRPEGATDIPWSALLYPDHLLLYERWAAWSKEHPGARPPKGFEEIAKPPPARMHGLPWDEALRASKRLLLHPARPRRGHRR